MTLPPSWRRTPGTWPSRRHCQHHQLSCLRRRCRRCLSSPRGLGNPLPNKPSLQPGPLPRRTILATVTHARTLRLHRHLARQQTVVSSWSRPVRSPRPSSLTTSNRRPPSRPSHRLLSNKSGSSSLMLHPHRRRRRHHAQQRPQHRQRSPPDRTRTCRRRPCPTRPLPTTRRRHVVGRRPSRRGPRACPCRGPPPPSRPARSTQTQTQTQPY